MLLGRRPRGRRRNPGDAGGEPRGFLVGSPRLFEERGISLSCARDALAEVADAGETPVVLGDEDGPAAVFGLADAVRPEARATLEALRAAGSW